MERSVKDLAQYRLEKSKKNLALAKSLCQDETYSFAVNRAYYAAFDAMRAVNALDGFDSSKHSGVIAHFDQFHVKTGDFDVPVSKVIRRAARLRERSDYEDFYEVGEVEAVRSIEEVEGFVEVVEQFLGEKLKQIEV